MREKRRDNLRSFVKQNLAIAPFDDHYCKEQLQTKSPGYRSPAYRAPIGREKVGERKENCKPEGADVMVQLNESPAAKR
jgi:hypothetical protein